MLRVLPDSLVGIAELFESAIVFSGVKFGFFRDNYLRNRLNNAAELSENLPGLLLFLIGAPEIVVNKNGGQRHQCDFKEEIGT
jgi:hypothetical protein